MKKFFVVAVLSLMSSSVFALGLGAAVRGLIGSDAAVYVITASSSESKSSSVFGLGYGFGKSPLGAVLSSTGGAGVEYKGNLFSMFSDWSNVEYSNYQNQFVFATGFDFSIGQIKTESTTNSVVESASAMNLVSLGANARAGYSWDIELIVNLTVTAGIGARAYYYYKIDSLDTSWTFLEDFQVNKDLWMVTAYIPVAVDVLIDDRFKVGVEADIGLRLWSMAENKPAGLTFKTNRDAATSNGALAPMALSLHFAYLF
ncbi:MAG: hypothetical protein Ta2A_14700 [Treponemataceae bacterium]|nr:MAG: hypothetical protein Ta2A_14700 [Treponemataceae bacterium]